jgi:hypothetical protein
MMETKMISESGVGRGLGYETPVYRPLSQRINLRLILFVLIVGALVGYPVYVFVDAAVSGGIKNAGGGYKEVDLKAMSTFWFDQSTGTINDVPKKWRDLDGQKVVMYGEMWDSKGTGPYVSQFQLCYSIAKCCFSGPPQVQHFVDSTAVPNVKLSYYSGLVKVQGILHVKVKAAAGKVQSVYQMDVESIEAVQ